MFSKEYFEGDPNAWELLDTILPSNLSAEEAREACRALAKLFCVLAKCVGGNFASALPSGLEDGRAGGISMSLEFLVLFFQEKSTEKKYIFAQTIYTRLQYDNQLG